MTTYTDLQIRQALQDTIQTAAPLAVVYPWWVLGVKQDMWPGLLRSAADNNRVHGYVITRVQNVGTEAAMRCVDRLWTFDIWALQYYNTGNISDNSDLQFNSELDAINSALDDVAALPLALKRREPISWSIDLNMYGGELLHFGIGTINVDPC